MDAQYWHGVWDSGDIKFHQAAYNPLLLKHFAALNLTVGARVFVPLCGKTRDIHWLLEQGCSVVGAELNEMAVKDLFDDLGLVPDVTAQGALIRYASGPLVVFVGDIFALTAAALGHVQAIYDRAALVALPEEMRQRYTAHVMAITQAVPQLLLTYEYDQSAMAPPPFSISTAMVESYYGAHYQVTPQEVFTLPAPGLKGQVPATETAWVLS